MKLFAGARVKLRNGSERVIRKSDSESYPWAADDYSKPELCWTDDGYYTVARIAHSLDIVEVISKPDPDLFSVFPYAWNRSTWPAGVKFRLRNGWEIDGLTFLGDEAFTSQRDIVWNKDDGKCVYYDQVKFATAGGHSGFDMIAILAPKSPAELASKHLNPDLLIRDEIDPYFAGNMNETSLDPVNTESDFDPLKLFDSIPEPAKDPLADDQSKDYPYTKPQRHRVNLGHMSWDAVDDPNVKGYKVYRDTDWITYDESSFGYVPGKHLMRLMKNMSKALGGTFNGYMWDSPYKITFHVLFDNRKRKGGHVRYLKTVTIEVSGCDGNAILPMKKGK